MHMSTRMHTREHTHTQRQAHVDNANNSNSSSSQSWRPRISTVNLRNGPATSETDNLLVGRFSVVEPDLVCPKILPDQYLV